MRTIPYREILERVCDHMGWDPDNLDARQFASVRRAVTASLADIWNRYWWADLVRCEERTFRPPYSSLTTYAAGTFVWLAGPRAYYQALQTTTGNVPATLTDGVWVLNAQYWAVATPAPAAAAYSATASYAVGDLVTWDQDNRVYQCIQAGTGTLPSSAYWGRVEPFDAYVDLLEPGFVTLGRVRALYDCNPRINAGASRVEWANSHRGVEVYTTLPTVWVEGLMRPHRFTGDAWSSAAAYTATTGEDLSGLVTTTVVVSEDASGAGYPGIASLRARVIHLDNQLAYLLYVATEADGGGGWFRFVSASADGDDGVDVLRPDDIISSNPGRWKRVS